MLPSEAVNLRTITKSLNVPGMLEKVTLEADDVSVCEAIAVYALMRYPLIPYREKREPEIKLPRPGLNSKVEMALVLVWLTPEPRIICDREPPSVAPPKVRIVLFLLLLV